MSFGFLQSTIINQQFNSTAHSGRNVQMSEEFDPKIIAFACNWCAYSAADLAGVSRLQYPTSMRIIRVLCSGRINPNFILKSFEMGADGVLVAG